MQARPSGVRIARVLTIAASVALIGGAALFSIGGWQLARIAMGPRLPPHASPARDSDAAFFRESVLANERSGSAAQRAAFDDYSADLAKRAPKLEEPALALEYARALALFDNAHTHVIDARLKRLPLRFHWFADGLFVVKAGPGREGLVGARVVSMEGRDPEQLLRELGPYIPGVEGWKRYRSEYFLSAPATLIALGASEDAATVDMEFAKRDGSTARLAIAADDEVLPADAFREFRHLLPLDKSFETEGWVRLADGIDPKPLYLREMPSSFDRVWLEEEGAMYVRLNGSNSTQLIDLPVFLDETLEAIRAHHAKHAIVDLRFDWGGDYMLTRAFSSELANALAPGGKVFIITGPNTFSAGLILAARLKYFAGSRAIVVGEPVGDRLQFWAEGLDVTLPRSQVELYLTTASHDFAAGCKLFERDCFVLDKFVGVAAGDLTPNLHAANTFGQFVSGHDAALDRIQEVIGRKKG